MNLTFTKRFTYETVEFLHLLSKSISCTFNFISKIKVSKSNQLFKSKTTHCIHLIYRFIMN